MTVTLKLFSEHLIQSGLLSPDDLEAFIARCHPAPTTAQQLARDLIESGRLTKFQVSMIAQGKSRSLSLGIYEIRDILGAGGMGHVYLARHRRMNRLVAIKVLPPRVTSDPRAVERFHREVRAAAQLTHPNIVTAFDANEDKQVHYLVMEYVPGDDLATLVKSRGPFSISKAIACVIQAARGLHYAHSCGIIHRDIKPANLLLDRRGVVKILDMGLARTTMPDRVSADDDSDELGVILGTVDFMAPEQAHNTRRADARSDIYSLGCTLFMLLTGRPVFPYDTVKKKLRALQTEPAPSLQAARPEVSKELEAIYRQMVARNPNDRFQTMAQVIAALERCPARQAAVRTKSYSDPQLREMVLKKESTSERWRKAPIEIDFSFLEKLTVEEFGADAPQVRGVLPPLPRRRRFDRRTWFILLGAVAAGVLIFLLISVAVRAATPAHTRNDNFADFPFPRWGVAG
ncbi:MAG: serine/threonine protein kinase [Pirellulaceae bacterium]